MAKQPMGMGVLASSDAIFKRKFRWKFTLYFTCDDQLFTFESINAYSASRPKITRDETEISYLGQKYTIPGSIVTYEPLEISLYDLVGVPGLKHLYYWIASYMRLANPDNGMTPPNTLFGIVILNLLDGCGNIIETWELGDVWPTNTDFGDLDMSSGDVCMMTLTLKYNLAKLTTPDENDCTEDLVLPTCCGVSEDAAFLADNPSVALSDITGDAPYSVNAYTYTGTYAGLSVTTNGNTITFAATSLAACYAIKIYVYVTLSNGLRGAVSGTYSSFPAAVNTATTRVTVQSGVSVASYEINVETDGMYDYFTNI